MSFSHVEDVFDKCFENRAYHWIRYTFVPYLIDNFAPMGIPYEVPFSRTWHDEMYEDVKEFNARIIVFHGGGTEPKLPESPQEFIEYLADQYD
jgi:hypothetical protein